MIKNVVFGIVAIVSAINFCVSMSAPESGSSRMASFGWVKINRNSINRLRSPPEKPTLILRFSHCFGMFNLSRADSRLDKNSPIGKSEFVSNLRCAAHECFKNDNTVNPLISGTC